MGAEMKVVGIRQIDGKPSIIFFHIFSILHMQRAATGLRDWSGDLWSRLPHNERILCLMWRRVSCWLIYPATRLHKIRSGGFGDEIFVELQEAHDDSGWITSTITACHARGIIL